MAIQKIPQIHGDTVVFDKDVRLKAYGFNDADVQSAFELPTLNFDFVITKYVYGLKALKGDIKTVVSLFVKQNNLILFK